MALYRGNWCSCMRSKIPQLHFLCDVLYKILYRFFANDEIAISILKAQLQNLGTSCIDAAAFIYLKHLRGRSLAMLMRLNTCKIKCVEQRLIIRRERALWNDGLNSHSGRGGGARIKFLHKRIPPWENFGSTAIKFTLRISKMFCTELDTHW